MFELESCVNVSAVIESLYLDTTFSERLILGSTVVPATRPSSKDPSIIKWNTTPGCKCDSVVPTQVTLVTKTMAVAELKCVPDGTILPPDLMRSLAMLVNDRWEKLLTVSMLKGTTSPTTYGGQRQKSKPLISVRNIA